MDAMIVIVLDLIVTVMKDDTDIIPVHHHLIGYGLLYT